jgi:hypothetical protein
MSTIKVDTIKNTSNVEVFTAKAWVNFNGTGSPSIRASGNVTSITDNGTGDYTVTFTTAMTDANYAVIASCMMGDNLGVSESFGVKGNASSGSMTAPALQSTTAVRLLDQDADGSDRDNPNLYVAVFR